MDLMKNARRWKLPAALDMYKSMYQKDFCWHNTYEPPNQENVPITSYHPTSDGYVPRCYLPKSEPPIQATPGRSGKLEILSEPQEGLLCCCRDLPPPAPAAGTEGTMLHREKVSPGLVSYVQFTRDLYRERLDNADQYKNKMLGSSVVMEDCSVPDWRSTYQLDFPRRTGVHGGLYTEQTRPSPVFPADSRLNQGRWVSEYADNYSVFLKKLDWSTPIPCPWMLSGKDMRWRPRCTPRCPEWC
ncbi:uncharacterized protein LOC108642073 [Manacus vitellinus]|uniref:uncharacterized protein LOC108642073 n=1 Tax=Manacus vitellinus TaxID=328815 RepID=UPI00115D0EC5|nr:uncharacterized protein LOC108642073 [Manacus vitellinus]XP_029821189.1 uncharacterized protein LOC108642073 [Manacus vitellinus]XP_051654108.1 uncharacterized protein LOC127475928 [Manacus candei]XP_051654109.1 uncharacterized protein LOC127475928 [Manacus candei]XP_051654110.1 uncharacterized protein LOC127475928 [Manacus candei]